MEVFSRGVVDPEVQAVDKCQEVCGLASASRPPLVFSKSEGHAETQGMSPEGRWQAAFWPAVLSQRSYTHQRLGRK